MAPTNTQDVPAFLDGYPDADDSQVEGEESIPIPTLQDLLDSVHEKIAHDPYNITSDTRALHAAAKALRTLSRGNQLPHEFGRGKRVDVSLVGPGWIAAKAALIKADPEVGDVDGYLFETARGAIKTAAWESVQTVGTPSHKSQADQRKHRLNNPWELRGQGSRLDDLAPSSSAEASSGSSIFNEAPGGGPLEEAAEDREYQRYLSNPRKFRNDPPPKPRGNPVNVRAGEDRTYYLRSLANINDPIAELTEAETLAAVREWLQTLEPDEQELLKLRFGFDLIDDPAGEGRESTYEEIAEHLGCSKSKVERDIKKALRKGLLEMLNTACNL
jgi:RNA polymerase sigma factor (sigma-70 family)